MRALVAAAVVLVSLLSYPADAEAADGECPSGQVAQPVIGHGAICVSVTDPGEPDQTGPGDTTHTTGVALCTFDGQEIPCVSEHGVWFASRQCYAQPMQPQPSAASPAWEGHAPSDGQVWLCSVYSGPGTNGNWFFVHNGEVPALVDPGEVAANAVDQLPLAVPVVHLAPSPPAMTFVGLDTWLWIDPDQWRDLSLTVTAGGTSVTVLAHPTTVTWDLTEKTVECDSPGRPWQSSLSSDAQTDCSYAFQTVSDHHRDGVFDVTATLTYEVRWTCSGACSEDAGDLGEVDGLPGLSAIRVGERQSVVVSG